MLTEYPTTPLRETTGADMTEKIRTLLGEVADVSAARRKWWFEQNQAGIPQATLAVQAAVVTHTVYSEIRRHREGA
tara:strand:+ start:178 stop:405 length:228 start_codon:yes stop_codon:yes gene_type:complete